jgi:energy-converting hydrogenase Eha subunit C
MAHQLKKKTEPKRKKEMKIQQAIIVIMLTAIICVFLGLVLDNVGDVTSIAPLYKIVMFGFVLMGWIMLITITDLYMTVSSLRTDMNTHMPCASAGQSPPKPT